MIRNPQTELTEPELTKLTELTELLVSLGFPMTVTELTEP
jgi:hypothetical protein